MRLALLQMRAGPSDPESNLQRIAAAAEQAAAAGADLLLVPELAVTGYGAGESFADLAEDTSGHSAEMLARLSQRFGLALVIGFAERDGDMVYNSALFLRAGRVEGCYRKRQLYGAYERGHFQPGDRCAELFEVAGLRCGIAICYDIEFPETARELAMAGADCVLVPTALPASAHAAFIAGSVLPVRAFENQLFVAYCNFCGQDDGFAYAGMSGIWAPDGRDLARAGEDEALLIADLDRHGFAQCRADNPYLADLRTTGRA
jgi:5-aminopentanamidase